MFLLSYFLKCLSLSQDDPTFTSFRLLLRLSSTHTHTPPSLCPLRINAALLGTDDTLLCGCLLGVPHRKACLPTWEEISPYWGIMFSPLKPPLECLVRALHTKCCDRMQTHP